MLNVSLTSKLVEINIDILREINLSQRLESSCFVLPFGINLSLIFHFCLVALDV